MCVCMYVCMYIQASGYDNGIAIHCCDNFWNKGFHGACMNELLIINDSEGISQKV